MRYGAILALWSRGFVPRICYDRNWAGSLVKKGIDLLLLNLGAGFDWDTWNVQV
jgi:hypothetical protein